MPNIKITKRHNVIYIESDEDSDFDLPLPERKPQLIDLSKSPPQQIGDKREHESHHESSSESESEKEKQRRRQKVKIFLA